MEGSNLFIIGNGFDLFHRLPTRYSDFEAFISKNDPELETRLENYFNFKLDDNYLWRDFENDLSTYDYSAFYEEYNFIDVTSETFKPSEVYGLEDEIDQEMELLVEKIRANFEDWIRSIDLSEVPAKQQKLEFANCEFFINFNYTDTLEEYYNIPKRNILYIHNNANEYSGELIFGHGQPLENSPREPEQDEEGNSNRTMFTDAEDNARHLFYEFIKPTEKVLENKKSFFNSLQNIEKIIVLGHSLGEVDWPYFQEMNRRFPAATWQISYYTNEEKNELYSITLKMLGNEKSKIEMIRIEDLLVYDEKPIN